MQLEIRRSGGEKCDCCGAYELLHVDEAPLRLDLTQLLELEALRREVKLAKVFKAHLAGVERDHTETFARLSHEWWQERVGLMSELEGILAGMTLDVPAWRLLRRQREKRLAARVREAQDALMDLTRQGFTEPPRKELAEAT